MVIELVLAAEAPLAAATDFVEADQLARGAIIGAMLISAAFLAGIAVLRSSAAAFTGFIMVASAGVLLAFWLGLAGEPGPALSPLLQGVFAASVLIFLTATVPLARDNRFLGGMLFVGALSIVGIAVLNVALVGEATHLQRMGIYGAALATLAISGIDSVRGDNGARLILPGALLAAAAPLFFSVGGGSGPLAIAPQAIFAAGVLTASLVALLNPVSARAGVAFSGDATAQRFDAGAHGRRHGDHQGARHATTVSENQLAQVLDYSGIAVWDWCRNANHQTASFGEVMGADCDGLFTPDAIRDFVHPEERDRFEQRIFGPSEGDGGFDEVIRLVGGKAVRMRGARAVAKDGALERIVVFLERSECVAQHEAVKPDALKLAAVTLTGAAAAATSGPRCHDVASPHHSHHDHDDDQGRAHGAEIGRKFALKSTPASPAPEKALAAAVVAEEKVVAAFQPIVSFENGRVCGAEAVLRSAPAGYDDAKLAAAMLKEAAAHSSERIKAGDSTYFTSVNLTAAQLRSEGFVTALKGVIAEHRLPRRALVLEFSNAERLLEDPQSAKALKDARTAGAALAYDGFGAGYSSLSKLHKYEFDILKIDRAYLDDIAKNGGRRKIAAALAKLGRDFDMTVIAEGIESDASAKIAKSIGCGMGQGDHFGEPSAAAMSAVYGANDDAPHADHDHHHTDAAPRRGFFGRRAR
jgi:EAL domain-containing protein (putative c-di-GMP-specific phosphodiesterase class I)